LMLQEEKAATPYKSGKGPDSEGGGGPYVRQGRRGKTSRLREEERSILISRRYEKEKKWGQKKKKKILQNVSLKATGKEQYRYPGGESARGRLPPARKEKSIAKRKRKK